MKKRIIAALLLALSTAAPFAAAAEEEISVDAIAIEGGDYAVIQDLDENGLPVKETFYGLDGNVMAVDGYTSASLIYNQKGQLIRKTCLNESDERIISEEGYVVCTYDYDTAGNLVQECFYGLEGQAVSVKDGYAAIRRKYNKAGQEILTIYLDENGTPVNTAGGYAYIRREYNNSEITQQGMLIYEAYFGADGAPAACEEGWSVHTLAVSEDGTDEEMKEMFFDTAGNPMEAAEQNDAEGTESGADADAGADVSNAGENTGEAGKDAGNAGDNTAEAGTDGSDAEKAGQETAADHSDESTEG